MTCAASGRPAANRRPIARASRKDDLAVRRFDLLAEALAVKAQQRVLWSETPADGIRRPHNAIAAIDRVHHGGEHADIGLGATDDQAVGAAASQPVRSARARRTASRRPCRSRRPAAERRQWRHQFQQARVDAPKRRRRNFGSRFMFCS